jgi:wyosine [tRNA(Phe)-imidazoG37] synthetase (radical SAM superfamily)
MSGGHFNYTQYQLTQIADDIEQLIVDNDNGEWNEWGDVTGHNYTAETISAFQTAVEMLRQSYIYVRRVDWLVSGDDSEKDFHTRLRKELRETT